MWAKPRSQQGPKAFHGVDVDFMQAITVIIPSLFATVVTDTFMGIAPLCQAAIHVVRIRVNTGARRNRRVDQWLDRPLLDVFPPPNHHGSTALAHPEDRGLLRGECPTSAFPLEASAPAAPPCFSTASGVPLWPATMETSSHSPSSVHGGEGFWRTMPWRH